MKTTQLLTICAISLLFSNCKETKQQVTTAGDVSFARNTFESLARGDSKVADKIDWPVFTSMGSNIGSTYVALTSGVEKDQFVTNFISQFAISFRENGGKIEDFTNWRVSLHDKLKTEVAADSPTGVLTVTVAERDDVERVSSINIIK
ncbi:MAG TPA: hypothetical protein VF258_03895 [Luteolibacter sp.]